MNTSLEESEIEQVAKSKELAKNYMRKDIIEYKKKMGNKATFKGWIAHFVPENVTIDKRILQEDSEWTNLWREKTIKYLSKKNSLKLTRNKTLKKS